MIEVFKTNIENEQEAQAVYSSLRASFPDFVIHFDLEDCDKILRIKCDCIDALIVIELMGSLGFACEILEN